MDYLKPKSKDKNIKTQRRKSVFRHKSPAKTQNIEMLDENVCNSNPKLKKKKSVSQSKKSKSKRRQQEQLMKFHYDGSGSSLLQLKLKMCPKSSSNCKDDVKIEKEEEDLSPINDLKLCKAQSQ